MNIQPINFKQENANQCRQQPTFSGYVDKSAIKHMNKITAGSIRAITSQFNYKEQPVNKRILLATKQRGTDILEKLSKVMEAFHPKTRLAVRNEQFQLENPLLGTRFRFHNKNSEAFKHTKFKIAQPLDVKSCFMEDLDNVEKFSNEIQSINAKRFDSELFFKFINKSKKIASSNRPFAGLITKLRGKKADKLASEFGQTTGWSNVLNKIRQENIESQKTSWLKTKNELKEVARLRKLAKHNEKIANKVIKSK